MLFRSPELVEKTAFVHFIEIAPVDQLLWLDVFGAWFCRSDLFQNCRNGLRSDLQPWFQRGLFQIITRFENLTVGDTQVLRQNLEGELFVRLEDPRGLRH